MRDSKIIPDVILSAFSLLSIAPSLLRLARIVDAYVWSERVFGYMSMTARGVCFGGLCVGCSAFVGRMNAKGVRDSDVDSIAINYARRLRKRCDIVRNSIHPASGFWN